LDEIIRGSTVKESQTGVLFDLFFKDIGRVKRVTLVRPYLSILCGIIAIVCEGGAMISVDASPSALSFLSGNSYSIWRLSGLVGRTADL
jgi:hypothetical protein